MPARRSRTSNARGTFCGRAPYNRQADSGAVRAAPESTWSAHYLLAGPLQLRPWFAFAYAVCCEVTQP
jgi:hypothetical protein